MNSGASSSLAGFDVAPSRNEGTTSAEELSFDKQLLNFLENVLPVMNPDQLTELAEELMSLGVIKESDDGEGVEYDAKFDLTEEIGMQLKMVHALRRKVMVNGTIRSGVSAREVKEVVSTTSTMLNTLMKNHEKMMSMDRQRAVESSTISVLRELGNDGLVDKFFEKMGEALEGC